MRWWCVGGHGARPWRCAPRSGVPTRSGRHQRTHHVEPPQQYAVETAALHSAQRRAERRRGGALGRVPVRNDRARVANRRPRATRARTRRALRAWTDATFRGSTGRRTGGEIKKALKIENVFGMIIIMMTKNTKHILQAGRPTRGYKLAAPRKGFFLPPFFEYNKRLLRQKTGGACLYMPQDGHCSLASQF